MGISETLKILNDMHDQCCEADNILCTDVTGSRCEALEAAMDAVEKQIPKDAYTVWDTSFGCHKPQCPVCMATNPRMVNYCCNCGQALSNTDV